MIICVVLLVQGGFGGIGQGNLASRLTINATGTVGANGSAQLIFDNAGTGFGTLSYDADGNDAVLATTVAVRVPTTGDVFALTPPISAVRKGCGMAQTGAATPHDTPRHAAEGPRTNLNFRLMKKTKPLKLNDKDACPFDGHSAVRRGRTGQARLASYV